MDARLIEYLSSTPYSSAHINGRRYAIVIVQISRSLQHFAVQSI